MEANDAAAAGCWVVSTIRENTMSTLVEWSAYTCFSISWILLGSLILCQTVSVSFLTNDGRENVPAHGKIFDNRGDVAGLGRNPQNGVALSNVTHFTRCGLDAVKYKATKPPREFPTI
uniref:Uncharacterized protein n=1 Tax=Arundo donax TaxID=35708 RepID=A0A0A9DUX6_ARUDO